MTPETPVECPVRTGKGCALVSLPLDPLSRPASLGDGKQPLDEPAGDQSIDADDMFPAVGALAADVSIAARSDAHDVLRVWLSSIRPQYRRHVRGRSTLRSVDSVNLQSRRRAS